MKTLPLLFILGLGFHLSFLAPAQRAQADTTLGQQLKEVVQADAQLSDENKSKLSAIIDRLTQKNEEIQAQIREKKIELLKALLAKPKGSKEAKSLKRSIIRLHDQKLENGLKALEDLKDVLGHQKDPEILFQKILELGGRN